MRALLEEVRELLGQRKKIEAIKHVREVTRVGLKEAKDLVEGVERGETPELLIGSPQAPTKPAGLPPAFWQEVREMIASGKLIEAMKHVREKTQVGLKEAKETVEALAAGRPPPGHAAALLPDRCAGCGAAQSPLKVRWLAPEIAECPYCSTHHICR